MASGHSSARKAIVLTTKAYGRLFLNSLPPMTRVDSAAEAAVFLRERLAE